MRRSGAPAAMSSPKVSRVAAIIFDSKGPGATAIPLEVAPFTLVGATTRSGLLTGPLRDRFGFTAHMEPYSTAELERVLHRSASLLGVRVDTGGAAEIAGYGMDLAERLEALPQHEAQRLVSAKDSPLWAHEEPLD